jgi:hypothetical protein
VTAVDPEGVTVEEHPTAVKAIKAAAALLAPPADPPGELPSPRDLALADIRRLMTEHGIVATEL